MKLSKMPNIGSVLEKRLIESGIEDVEQLKNVGSKAAFMKIKLIENDACFNTLCALEGAIQGIRWHYLNDDKKEELRKFFNAMK